MDSFNSPTTKPLYKGIQILWYILYIIEISLLFRLFLKLFIANADAIFTRFIYNTTDILVSPFASVFRVTYLQGSIFEWTTILAIFVYWILIVAIIKLFLMGKTVSTPEAASRLEKQESTNI